MNDDSKPTTEELKPCPFDGCKATINETEPYTGAYSEFSPPDFQLNTKCGRVTLRARGSKWIEGKGTVITKEEAIKELTESWNTRV